MKNILKLNITLRILVGVVLMFLVSNIILYKVETKQMFDSAEQKANSDMDRIIAYADNQLKMAECGASNLPGQLCDNLLDRNRLFESLARYMDANPYLEAVTVALDPALVPQDSLGYCLSVSRADTGYAFLNIHETYDYRHRDWFTSAMESDTGRWAEPFRSAVGEVIVPYAFPLKDSKGKPIGVLCAAISLESLSTKLEVTKPFDSSTVFLLARNGQFLAHPDKKMILTVNASTLASQVNSKSEQKLADDLSHLRRGQYRFKDSDGVKKVLYYAPVTATDWAVLVECLESDITEGVGRMNIAIFISLIINLLFFGTICWRIIKLAEQLEKESVSKSKIENELQTASRIQMAMVPKIFPPYPERSDMDIFATIQPAKAVGGDLYDFLLKDKYLFFTIGDVSGKGVPASLFMAITRTLFRTACSHSDDPAEILTEINNLLSKNNDENMFVTMQVARLNLTTGELVYSNAGHNAPVVLKKCQSDGVSKAFFRKVNSGLPIGCMPGFTYVNEYAQLSANDCVFAYTDGVTEAANAQFELFGEERLLAVLGKTQSSDTVNDIVNQLCSALKDFSGDAEQSDDITLMCMEWKGPASSTPAENK